MGGWGGKEGKGREGENSGLYMRVFVYVCVCVSVCVCVRVCISEFYTYANTYTYFPVFSVIFISLSFYLSISYSLFFFSFFCGSCFWVWSTLEAIVVLSCRTSTPSRVFIVLHTHTHTHVPPPGQIPLPPHCPSHYNNSYLCPLL